MPATFQPKANQYDAAYPVRAFAVKVAEWLEANEGTTVPHAVGPQFVQQSDKPPRYTWVPTEDDFSDSTDKVAYNPKAIRTAWFGVDVYVWGTSYAHAHALTHALVRAIYKAGVGAFRLRGGAWTQPGTRPGARDDGKALEPTREYRLRLQVLAPYVDATLPTAGPPIDFEHDGQFVPGVGDGDC